MPSSTFARLAVVGAAAALTAASAAATTKQKGPTKTAQDGVLFDPRPTFTWPAKPGARYELTLYRVVGPDVPRQVIHEARGVTGGSWTVPGPLAWNTRYELYLHYDGNTQVLTSWGFTIGFAPPAVVSPTPDAPARTLTPTIRIAPQAYPHVAFAIELAEDPAFTQVLGEAVLVQAEHVVTEAGPDGAPGTADDVAAVPWTPAVTLQADRTYHWRLRAHHFRDGQLTPGAPPDLASAAGASEATGTLVVPPQGGPDALASLTWLIDEPAGASMPAVSKKLDLAYVAEQPDGGAVVRIARATPKTKVPAYGAAREDATTSVSGSRDQRPAWDADGKALFFDSDRAQGVANLWLKKLGASGYTQLTFADRGATHVSVGADGKRMVCQMAGADGAPAIWIANRDGKDALEIGPGEHPRLSPDGRWIAFVQRGERGRDLWVMDTAGGQRRQLTTAGDAQLPAWIPGLDVLVYVSDAAGNEDLWMVHAQGGEPVQLTTYLGTDTQPVIAPDRRHVLFASRRGGGGALGVWMGELPPPPPPPSPAEAGE